jgi:hypothetical protein
MHVRNARNAMQCIMHVIQCNAMQCNNVCTEVRPSVRNEVSQSFFFYFFLVSMYEVRQYVRNIECHGWTDKFQLFCQYVRMSRMDRQVSVISV